MVRLLSVIPVLGAGGAEVVATTLAVDARQRGHEVMIASAGGFRADEVVAAGVPHRAVRLDSRRAVDLTRSVRALRRLRRGWAPEVVHAHNVKAAVVARLAVGGSAPVVTTLHGVPDGALATGARLLRRTSDRVVAVSPHVADGLVEHGYPAARVSVIENAVTPPPRRDREQARRRLGIAPGAVVGLCLARLAAQKRHDLLVRAWERLPLGSVLLLAGDGPTRGAVETLVAQGTRAGDIRLLGERTDADWLLAAADFLVLPTDWEGLPISLLEAMSLGLPVVVSRVGGVLETLGEGVRLVEPGSVDALAAALGELATDVAARQRLGLRGHELVAERFHLAPMLDAYAATYDEALRDRTAAGAMPDQLVDAALRRTVYDGSPR